MQFRSSFLRCEEQHMLPVKKNNSKEIRTELQIATIRQE